MTIAFAPFFDKESIVEHFCCNEKFCEKVEANNREMGESLQMHLRLFLLYAVECRMDKETRQEAFVIVIFSTGYLRIISVEICRF